VASLQKELVSVQRSEKAAFRDLNKLQSQLQRSEKRLLDAGALLSQAEARLGGAMSEVHTKAAETDSKYRASLVQIRTMQEAAIKVKKIHESEAAWLSDSLQKSQQGKRQLENEMCALDGALQDELETAIEAKLKSDRATALRQLRSILHRLLRGEASYRLALWKQGKQQEARQSQLDQRDISGETERDQLSKALQRETARRISTSQTAACQVLKAVLLNAWKGSQGVAVRAWRSSQKQACLSARLDDAVWGGQLRQLRPVIARLIRGELGLRVAVWRQGAITAVGAGYMATLRGLQANAFLAAIKHAMLSQARGEACARLALWRDSTRHHTSSEWGRAVEQNKAELIKTVALKQVAQIWTRMLQGDTAMRLCVWRQEVRSFYLLCSVSCAATIIK